MVRRNSKQIGKLEDPSGKVRYYFYYCILQLLYVIMLITRMVPNILPSIFSLLFVGNYCRFNKFFATVDKFYLEVKVWIVQTLYFAVLNILHTATLVMHFLCQIFTYFCEWEPPDSNRRLCRVITNTFILKDLTPLIAIDQKYILLSCYKLHRYISYFFQHNEMKSLFERFALTLYIHDVASLSIIL